MSTRKVTGLPLPETPKEAPPEFHGLVDAIEDRLAESNSLGGVSALACTFDYLTRYFAAVAGAVCVGLGLPGDSSVSGDFEAGRVLLKERLTTLGERATDECSKQVRSVFFVGATRQAPTPRRHARLLDLGGIPIRGYLNLREWIALEPGGPELANDSKANRELLRYLPILKEWITAASPYFLDIEQGPLQRVGDDQIAFTISLGGLTQTVGPIGVLPECLALLKPFFVASSTAVPEPEPPVSVEEPVPPEVGLSDTSEYPVPQEIIEPTVEFDHSVAAQPLEVSSESTALPSVSAVPAMKAGESEGTLLDPKSPRPEFTTVEVPAVPAPLEEPSVPLDPEFTTVEVPAVPASLEEPPVSLDPASSEAPAVSASTTPLSEPERVLVEVREVPPSATLEVPSEPAPSEPDQSAAQTFSQSESLSTPPTPELEVPSPSPLEVRSEPPTVTEPSQQPLPSAETVSPESEEDEFDDFDDFDDDEDEFKSRFDDDLDDDDAEKARIAAIRGNLPEHKPVVIDTSRGERGSVSRATAGRLKPDKEELADPVIAALNAPLESKERSPAAPMLQLYPVPTGPPPEFFDEIEVESDYPEILTTALTDLNGAIESNDSRLICGQLQRCFDIMIQFFAGLVGAVLQEIDRDALSDFDLEDGRFDLEGKIDLIAAGLSSMEEHWEGHDSANLVWSVFYDTLLPGTDPNSAYLHTRLLGVEGLVPDPYLEFAELCAVVPGQGALSTQEQCREMAHCYLPILAFWLENAMPLFLECEIDFVEEDDSKAQSWAATLAGVTLDGTPSGFWLEIASDRWNLPRPELAPVFVSGDAPDVLVPVFDELNSALEAHDFTKAGLYSRVALDFLVQYFTGCAASLWRQQGAMTEQALELFYPEASLAERERLLHQSLGGISTEREMGSNLSKIITKRSLQYRALAQRGQPQAMKSISDWAVKRDAVGEAELLVYLPLLRSWIGAANPWFSGGEQLFEEPSEEGILEGVVAYGDDFLEIVDPEYVIRLTRECLELVAPFDEVDEEEDDADQSRAETPFTGQLPPLPILNQGPPVLLGHLGRLLESANDRRTSNAWMGSAFEYLIQYYTGLCATVLGGKTAPVERSALEGFSPSASLRRRELLLVECIEHLKKSATGDVQESIRDIFLKPDGSYRFHTKFLGVLGPGSLNENEMLLSFWCRARHQAGHLTTEELHFGMSVLNSWVEASKPFFSSCEHYAEEPGADGQEEMVVELADDYLDMVLPDYAIQIPARGYYEVLYSETDSEAVADAETYFPDDVRPELLGPRAVVLGGAADLEGEELLGAAVELGGDMFSGPTDAYSADDLFAGSSVASTAIDPDALFAGVDLTPEVKAPKLTKFEQLVQEAKAERERAEAAGTDAPTEVAESLQEPEKRKRKKKKSRKQELGNAVLELYKKERLEKARKRAEARARKAEAAPTVLKYTIQYRGLKNSKQIGGRGHIGLIDLNNIGGGVLKGTIEPAHPCVRIQPNRFDKNQVRVSYQIDPSDIPSTGRAGVAINTQDQRVVIRIEQLVPTSWWSERTMAQAIAILASPSLIYAAWLLVLMTALLGPAVERDFMRFASDPELQKLPLKLHLKAWIFAVLAILPGATALPALQKWLYSKLDYTVQEEAKWALAPLMMLPSLIMAVVLYGTDFWVFDIPSGRLPLLGSSLVLTVFTFGLNLLAASLFSLQTTAWWEDRQETKGAKRTFYGFWIITVLIGVVLTFFMR